MTTQNKLYAMIEADLSGISPDVNCESEAYHTGWAAAEAGEPRSACQYAIGTWESINWLAGWDAAS